MQHAEQGSRRPWFRPEHKGFTSFKTTAPIVFTERWARDVLIQATLDPDVLSIEPGPAYCQSRTGVVLAFGQRTTTSLTLIILSSSVTEDVAPPSGYDAATILSRFSILGSTALLTSRMIWSKRSLKVPPSLAVQISARARTPLTLRRLAALTPANEAAVFDSVLAMTCSGYLDLFWHPVLSDSTVVRLRRHWASST